MGRVNHSRLSILELPDELLIRIIQILLQSIPQPQSMNKNFKETCRMDYFDTANFTAPHSLLLNTISKINLRFQALAMDKTFWQSDILINGNDFSHVQNVIQILNEQVKSLRIFYSDVDTHNLDWNVVTVLLSNCPHMDLVQQCTYFWFKTSMKYPPHDRYDERYDLNLAKKLISGEGCVCGEIWPVKPGKVRRASSFSGETLPRLSAPKKRLRRCESLMLRYEKKAMVYHIKNTGFNMKYWDNYNYFCYLGTIQNKCISQNRENHYF